MWSRSESNLQLPFQGRSQTGLLVSIRPTNFRSLKFTCIYLRLEGQSERKEDLTETTDVGLV